MSKFKNLSTDYRQILAKASVSDRVKIAKSSFAQEILSQLPPSELARLFPKYYRDKIPAISKAYYGDFSSGYTSSSFIPDNSSYQRTPTTRPPSTAPDPIVTPPHNQEKPAWLNKFLGKPTTTPYDNGSPLASQRQSLVNNLSQQDRMKIMAIAIAEEGNKPLARKRLMETMFNRASAYGMPVNSRNIQEKYYSPFMPKLDPNGHRRFNQALKKLQSDPTYFQTLSSEMDEVLAGSNHSNYATQNSSRDVASRARVGQSIAVDDGQSDLMSRKDKKGTKYYDRREDKWYQNTIAQEREYAKRHPTAVLPQDATQTGKINPDTTTPKPTDKKSANSRQIKSPLASWKNEDLMNVKSKVGETTEGQRRGFMADRSFTSKGRIQRLHAGIDYFGKKGDIVSATEPGIVIRARTQKGYQGTVDVLHTGPDGKQYVVRYAHMNTEFPVKEGQKINAGDPVGTLNHLNHLHMEVRDYEKYKNNPFARPSPGQSREDAEAMGLYDPADYFAGKGVFSYSTTTTTNGVSAVPALPDNIPENVRNEIAKLSAEDQEAIRQKLEEIGPTGIETITRAIEESPSPKAAAAAVEAVQSATPAQVQRITNGDMPLSFYEGPNTMPTYAERRKMKKEGKFAVNLDTNYSKGEATRPFVVLPDDASVELQKAAAELSKRMVEDQKTHLGRDIKMGGKNGQGWTFRKDNLGPDGKPRGRPNTAHVELYALADKAARERYSQGDGAQWLAEQLADTIGKIPGATFTYPHGDKNTGKPTDTGTNIPMPGYKGIFGNENIYTEVDAAHEPLQRLKKLSQQRMQVEAAKTSPTAIIPQNNQTGVINPGPNGPVQAPEKAVQAVPETVPTPTAPQVTTQQTTPTAVPAPVEPSDKAAGESPTKITPKIDVKPSQSSPSVPMMKSGGEVQASGEDFSIVDNNSKRKLGEVSRGENIKFNTKGRVEVTPDQRIDPRVLESAQEIRQENHERVVENNKQEMPQATMMQGARVPEKAPTQFTSYEQWGHTETPASYVRAMAQAKGRKHDGSFPGSRFGEEQLSAI